MNFGTAGDVTTLVLYASGIRNNTGLSGVAARINGVIVPVQYAGVQGAFYGLDQINVNLPQQFRGTESATLEVSVNGLMSNILNLTLN